MCVSMPCDGHELAQSQEEIFIFGAKTRGQKIVAGLQKWPVLILQLNAMEQSDGDSLNLAPLFISPFSVLMGGSREEV